MSPSAPASPRERRPTSINPALVGEADAALYEAKRLGRNRSVINSALDLRYVEAASIQPDPQTAPAAPPIHLAGK